jgi:hypothetical protein
MSKFSWSVWASEWLVCPLQRNFARGHPWTGLGVANMDDHVTSIRHI